MMRARNWDAALLAWADTVLGAPYVWGRTDCVSLATTAITVMYPALAGDPRLVLWPTKFAALRARVTQPTLLPDRLAALGAAPVPLGFLQAGDLLVPPAAAAEEEPAVLVSLGATVLSTHPDTGVGRVPARHLWPGTVPWRLPHG